MLFLGIKEVKIRNTVIQVIRSDIVRSGMSVDTPSCRKSKFLKQTTWNLTHKTGEVSPTFFGWTKYLTSPRLKWRNNGQHPKKQEVEMTWTCHEIKNIPNKAFTWTQKEREKMVDQEQLGDSRWKWNRVLRWRLHRTGEHEKSSLKLHVPLGMTRSVSK